jgi:cellulose synthase/poly-beta-1,6-N-acetylglucosamine synthase-like glycosyltransferase
VAAQLRLFTRRHRQPATGRTIWVRRDQASRVDHRPANPDELAEAELRLDIVIPAHNEEHRIGRMLTAYRAGCPDPDIRFHVAMDACTDRTAAIVDEHRAADRRVRKHEYP